MTDKTPMLSDLHKHYVALTGLDLVLTMPRIYQWEAWKVHGWTSAELSLVVRHIQKRIKENRRRPESLLFRNLIQDTERFEEDLAEARALARVPKVNHALRSVMRASGRELKPEQGTARTPGQIIRQDLSGQFAKLRQQINGV
jgi:hypothetical protein